MPEWKQEIRQRLAGLDVDPRREAEIVEELAQHLDDRYSELRAAGLDDRQARAAALDELHAHELLRELRRIERPAMPPPVLGGGRGNMLADFWNDVRYGMRMLRKSPGLTAAAVLSLALGMGASTALFSIFDAVVLRPLPVAEPERLVLFTWESTGQDVMSSHSGYGLDNPATGRRSSGSFPYALFQEFGRQGEVLSHVFGFYPLGRANLRADGRAELALTHTVSGEYFTGLGLRPHLGRLLNPDDDRGGADPAAVISYDYWQTRFAGDPGVVGKGVFVNERAFTIVGVAPRDFYGTVDYSSGPELFLPLVWLTQMREFPEDEDPFTAEGYWWLGVLGRLQPGATLEQAQAALSVPFQHAVDELVREAKREWDIVLALKPGHQGQSEFRQRNADMLLYSLAIVGLVLLIACANVANLLLARATGRQREVAVRLALGSHRGRLVRQLLTESLLLAAWGAAAGVALAWLGKELLFAWLPVRFVPEALSLPLDLRVLGFAAAACLATTLLFGLAPALQGTRVDLVGALKESGRSATGAASRQRLSRALVVVQVALSMVVLAGAGLFLRTLAKLEATPAGFQTEDLLVFRMNGSLRGYRETRLADFYGEARRRLEGLPGVRSVAVSRNPLIGGVRSTRWANFQGYVPQPEERVIVHIHRVDGDFFRTLEVQVQGRDFTARDDHNAPPVAIVNEAVMRRYFEGRSPVGGRMDMSSKNEGGKVEIIGVAPDMKYDSLRNEAPPTVYVPLRQEARGLRAVTFLVRTAGPAEALGGAVVSAMRELDPNIPVFALQTQQELIRTSLEREREAASLSLAFALLALVLAAIGLYGIMAHAVSRRTNEIGIRMALGAAPGDIFGMVVRQGMVLVALGVAGGLAGAWWATRLIESRLYGVTPHDPLTLLGVAGVLVGVAVMACYVPARRATRVDPMVALRYE